MTKEQKSDGRVDVFIPKGYAGEEPDLLVGVNGVNYLLPRGKTSRVPDFVAREVELSRKAQGLLDRRIGQLLGEEA